MSKIIKKNIKANLQAFKKINFNKLYKELKNDRDDCDGEILDISLKEDYQKYKNLLLTSKHKSITFFGGYEDYSIDFTETGKRYSISYIQPYIKGKIIDIHISSFGDYIDSLGCLKIQTEDGIEYIRDHHGDISYRCYEYKDHLLDDFINLFK